MPPTDGFVAFGSVGPTAHPACPWWRIEVIDKRVRDRNHQRWVEWMRYRLVRSDGRSFIQQMIYDGWEDEPIVWEKLALDLEEMRRIDVQEPLPRPALQPFQIWLLSKDDRSYRYTVELNRHPPSMRPDPVFPLVLSPVDGGPLDGIEPQLLVWGPRAPWGDPVWLANP